MSAHTRITAYLDALDARWADLGGTGPAPDDEALDAVFDVRDGTTKTLSAGDVRALVEGS